jgi:hypothetical protein
VTRHERGRIYSPMISLMYSALDASFLYKADSASCRMRMISIVLAHAHKHAHGLSRRSHADFSTRRNRSHTHATLYIDAQSFYCTYMCIYTCSESHTHTIIHAGPSPCIQVYHGTRPRARRRTLTHTPGPHCNRQALTCSSTVPSTAPKDPPSCRHSRGARW